MYFSREKWTIIRTSQCETHFQFFDIILMTMSSFSWLWCTYQAWWSYFSTLQMTDLWRFNRNTNTESKEIIDDLVLKCAYDIKYQNHCVLFTIQKKSSTYCRHIIAFILISTFAYFAEPSQSFAFVFLLTTIFSFLYLLSSRVREESVYLFVPVGLQLKASFFLGNKSHLFISWSSIQDFLIVEVISKQKIIYCLVVIVKNFDGISYVTLFENTQPRLVILERVYKRFQTILKEHKKQICAK